jgi:hypothetical protein
MTKIPREKGQNERRQLRTEPRASSIYTERRRKHSTLRSSRQCLGEKLGNVSRRVN